MTSILFEFSRKYTKGVPQKPASAQQTTYQADTLKTKKCQIKKSLKKAIKMIGFYQFGLGFIGLEG